MPERAVEGVVEKVVERGVERVVESMHVVSGCSEKSAG